MKTLLLLLGIVAILVGGLWIGQGTDYVRWPASSFMIRHIVWAYFGIVLALLGLVMVVWSRRRPRAYQRKL